jgi:hypothetical protein
MVSLSAGLAGWGGRIRTSVWWNQNQATLSIISTSILKKAWNSALKVSIGYLAIQNERGV